MDTNLASARYGKRNRAAQLGVSATTFLTLCVWLGPNRACFVIALAAIVAAWVALCRRFPFVGVLTLFFFDVLVSSLLYRGGGYRGDWR